MEKKITISVISNSCEKIFSLTPNEAIKKIVQLYNENHYWVYLDSSLVHPSKITEETLLNVKNILITSPVVGG